MPTFQRHFLFLILLLGVLLGCTSHAALSTVQGLPTLILLGLCPCLLAAGINTSINSQGYKTLLALLLSFTAFVFSPLPFQTLLPSLCLGTSIILIPLFARQSLSNYQQTSIVLVVLASFLLGLYRWVASDFAVGNFGGQFLHQNYLGGYLLSSLIILPSILALYLSHHRFRIPLTLIALAIFSLGFLCLGYASGCRTLGIGLAVMLVWALIFITQPTLKRILQLGGLACFTFLAAFTSLDPLRSLGIFDTTRLGWYSEALRHITSFDIYGLGTFGITIFSHFPSTIPAAHSSALHLHSFWLELIYSYGFIGVLLVILALWGLIQLAYRSMRERVAVFEVGLLLGAAAFACLDSQYDILPMWILISYTAGIASHKLQIFTWVKRPAWQPKLLGLTALLLLGCSFDTLQRDMRSRHLAKKGTEHSLTRAAQISPSNPAYLFALGQYYLHDQTDTQATLKAVTAFKEVLKLTPDYVPAWSMLASAYVDHMPPLALSAWSEVLQRVPGDTGALLGIYTTTNSDEIRLAALTQLCIRQPQFLAIPESFELTFHFGELSHNPWQPVRQRASQMQSYLTNPQRLLACTPDMIAELPDFYTDPVLSALTEALPAAHNAHELHVPWTPKPAIGPYNLFLRNLDIPFLLQPQPTLSVFPLTQIQWGTASTIYGVIPGLPEPESAWDLWLHSEEMLHE